MGETTGIPIHEQITALGFGDEDDAGLRYLMGIVSLHVVYGDEDKRRDLVDEAVLDICRHVQDATLRTQSPPSPAPREAR